MVTNQRKIQYIQGICVYISVKSLSLYLLKRSVMATLISDTIHTYSREKINQDISFSHAYTHIEYIHMYGKHLLCQTVVFQSREQFNL